MLPTTSTFAPSRVLFSSVRFCSVLFGSVQFFFIFYSGPNCGVSRSRSTSMSKVFKTVFFNFLNFLTDKDDTRKYENEPKLA